MTRKILKLIVNSIEIADNLGVYQVRDQYLTLLCDLCISREFSRAKNGSQEFSSSDYMISQNMSHSDFDANTIDETMSYVDTRT